MIDLAIIGGGPAGISTALHVQAAAPHARVVVLEKARYPRDKICAGGIGGRAFRILERIGIEVDCPRVELGAVAMRIAGETVVVQQPACGAVVRRLEFDHAFARTAITRGIDVRDGCEVTKIAVDDQGVTIETTGEPVRARALIGADGVAGIVRRVTGFPRGALRAQVGELDTEGVAVDQPRNTVVFDFETTAMRGYAWDFPTQVAGQPLVCRGIYVLHDGKGRDDVRTRMTGYLTARGLDPARYQLKQFAEQGFEPGAAIARPRVLLVGEAAGIDIATGEGIGQAIEYGAIAGPYLARALARDELGFSDWARTVERHHLGWQLAIRHGCYRAFYGRRRPKIERLMPRLDQLFRLGVQDFAGAPLSKLSMLRGAGQFLAAFTRAKLA
ncbi:MAG: FAD-dependent monooxygenase [Kofleriaceae bacterium]